MAVDELVRRLVVVVVAPALSQHVLFVRLQHREPLDLPKVTGEARSGRYVPVSGRQPTHDLHLLSGESKPVSKPNYQQLATLSICFRNAITLFKRGHHAST